jgi:cytochrome P450
MLYLTIKHPEYGQKIKDSGIGSWQEVFRNDMLHWSSKEFLRIFKPAPLTLEKKALSYFSLNGMALKKGDMVHVDSTLNRHSDLAYGDGETFRPDRFEIESKKWPLHTYTPFSHG